MNKKIDYHKRPYSSVAELRKHVIKLEGLDQAWSACSSFPFAEAEFDQFSRAYYYSTGSKSNKFKISWSKIIIRLEYIFRNAHSPSYCSSS